MLRNKRITVFGVLYLLVTLTAYGQNVISRKTNVVSTASASNKGRGKTQQMPVTLPAINWGKVNSKDKEHLEDDRQKSLYYLNNKLRKDASFLNEVPEVRNLLQQEPLTLNPNELLSFKQVRSIQVDDLGIFSYDFFRCRFIKRGRNVFFEKTSGSQRKSGYLYHNDDKSAIFLGGWSVNNDPQTSYGSENSEAGTLYKISSSKLLMVFWYGNGFELFEIIK